MLLNKILSNNFVLGTDGIGKQIIVWFFVLYLYLYVVCYIQLDAILESIYTAVLNWATMSCSDVL